MSFMLFFRWLPAALLALVTLVAPSAAWSQWVAGRPNLRALYAAVGRMHNIDAGLLEAIAEVESGGDPLSVSPKGALGLMQLMPATAAEYAVPDPFDPVSSVLGAANFIDSVRSRFANSLGLQGLPDLLAAYNAGPGAVEKYGGVPPYPETHRYVKRVIDRYVSSLSKRPAAPAPFIVNKPPRMASSQAVILTTDADGSVLDQLTAIRRSRARFLAGMRRREVPVAKAACRQCSATSP